MVCSRRPRHAVDLHRQGGAGEGPGFGAGSREHSVSGRGVQAEEASTGICAAGRGKTLAVRSAVLPGDMASGGSRNLPSLAARARTIALARSKTTAR
jgi:hypothetical protein